MEYDDVILVGSSGSKMPQPIKTRHIKNNNIRKKRDVILVRKDTENKNLETLIVSQQVEIKKQKYRCVINVETNLSNRSTGHPRSQNKNHVSRHSVKKKYNERVVPNCLRCKCWSAKCRHLCQNVEINRRKSIKKPPNNIMKDLSPITLSSLDDDTISYEDISLDSFKSDSESTESKLDTLIKRTRDRDRKLQSKSSFLNRTSTYEEITKDKKAISNECNNNLSCIPTMVDQGTMTDSFYHEHVIKPEPH